MLTSMCFVAATIVSRLPKVPSMESHVSTEFHPLTIAFVPSETT